jgi:glutaminyl-peptide cyclotransferase
MPKKAFRHPAAAAMICCLFAVPAAARQSAVSTVSPKGVAATLPPSFDSTRAYKYLKDQCALGPRHPGGEGHARAIPYFIQHFQGLGLPVAKQEFVHSDVGDGHKVPLVNILVTVKGKDAKKPAILFCAHWDTRPRAEQDPNPFFRDRPILGANDGASGAAVLMELAHALKAQKPAQTVILALFDGEDYGREGSLDEYFLGARWFADHVPQPIDYALLLDMIGDKDLYLPLERNSLAQSPVLLKKIFARAAELGLEAFMPMPGPQVWDDHMPLQAKDIPAVDLIDFDYPAWHTQGDTPDQCSAHSLGVVGTLVTSLAYRGLR